MMKAQNPKIATTQPGQGRVAAPALKTSSRKGQYVTVASKLPFPIELRLCKPMSKTTQGQHGSTTETIFVPIGEIHVIRGNSYPAGNGLPKGFPRRPEMIEDDKGGYALTPKVPAEFWDEWARQNADTDMVKSGMIKAQSDLDSLAADAAEHANAESGLQPLNPDADEKGRPLDRRSPRPISAGITAVLPESRPVA